MGRRKGRSILKINPQPLGDIREEWEIAAHLPPSPELREPTPEPPQESLQEERGEPEKTPVQPSGTGSVSFSVERIKGKEEIVKIKTSTSLPASDMEEDHTTDQDKDKEEEEEQQAYNARRQEEETKKWEERRGNRDNEDDEEEDWDKTTELRKILPRRNRMVIEDPHFAADGSYIVMARDIELVDLFANDLPPFHKIIPERLPILYNSFVLLRRKEHRILERTIMLVLKGYDAITRTSWRREWQALVQLYRHHIGLLSWDQIEQNAWEDGFVRLARLMEDRVLESTLFKAPFRALLPTETNFDPQAHYSSPILEVNYQGVTFSSKGVKLTPVPTPLTDGSIIMIPAFNKEHPHFRYQEWKEVFLAFAAYHRWSDDQQVALLEALGVEDIRQLGDTSTIQLVTFLEREDVDDSQYTLPDPPMMRMQTKVPLSAAHRAEGTYILTDLQLEQLQRDINQAIELTNPVLSSIPSAITLLQQQTELRDRAHPMQVSKKVKGKTTGASYMDDLIPKRKEEADWAQTMNRLSDTIAKIRGVIQSTVDPPPDQTRRETTAYVPPYRGRGTPWQPGSSSRGRPYRGRGSSLPGRGTSTGIGRVRPAHPHLDAWANTDNLYPGRGCGRCGKYHYYGACG